MLLPPPPGDFPDTPAGSPLEGETPAIRGKRNPSGASLAVRGVSCFGPERFGILCNVQSAGVFPSRTIPRARLFPARWFRSTTLPGTCQLPPEETGETGTNSAVSDPGAPRDRPRALALSAGIRFRAGASRATSRRAVTSFDRNLLVRALLVALVTSAVTAVVVACTDEATSTAAMRVARLAALAPVIASVSILGVVAHSVARGEVRALGALGVAPWEAARGAVAAGALVGIAGLVGLLSPWSDPSSLFPAVISVAHWTVDPAGDLARAAGAVVSSDGTVALTSSIASGHAGAPARLDAIPCIAPIALIVPGWAATPMSRLLRGVAVAASGMGAVTALHLIAASRVPPLAGSAAVIPLLASTWLARRRA